LKSGVAAAAALVPVAACGDILLDREHMHTSVSVPEKIWVDVFMSFVLVE
jgi:hypothetical protein